MADRLLYVRGHHGSRTHILHVVALATWPTRNQRILRDYLRDNSEAAERYCELKQTITASGVDPSGYTAARTKLIQELTDQARLELGLPAVDVWEK